MNASWSTIEALRRDPALLANVEAAFREEDDQRAEREAIRWEGAGSVRGEAPHLTCQKADKWAKNPGLPRAVIPPLSPADLTLDEQRESFETRPGGEPLRPRSLHALPKIVRNADGELERLGDGKGENQDQARALFDLGHEAKAQRLACCGRFGRRVECAGAHRFFKRLHCGLRFHGECAPRLWMDLFSKYVALETLIKKRPHWVLARLDFTVRNTGQMPTSGVIRSMNRQVRGTLKRLLKGKKGWGYLWCDEFGFDNTNLHCHGLYYGPYLPHSRVVEEWGRQTKDSLRASIQSAKRDFRGALWHLLKYVFKPPGTDPTHLAHLEAAFAGVRRVHTMGLFYNPNLPEEEPPQESKCPHCGGHLFVGGYCPISDLECSGLRDVEAVRREAARGRVFSAGAGPP